FGVFSGLFTDAEVGGSASLEEKPLFTPKNGAGKSGFVACSPELRLTPAGSERKTRPNDPKKRLRGSGG
ncbi:hypothetical protein BV228_15445, partial [Lactiplantibacillus plantarum]